jgi:hypothetical protein
LDRPAGENDQVVKAIEMVTKLGIAALALVIVLAGAAAPTMACNCPKEQLIKKYGTVSQVRTPVPLPPPLPTVKAATPTG